MAEAVTAGELEPAGDEVGAQAAVPAPIVPVMRIAPEADHAAKFRAAFLVLGIVLTGAIVALVLLLLRPSAGPPEGWSDWEPSAGASTDRAAEIANHVAATYKLPSGSQLVTVQASDLVVQDLPVSFIAIQSKPDGTVYTQDTIPVLTDAPDRTVAYLLCGLGQDCAIEEGTPSVERQRLLRREALELALYTFQYLDGMDYVVAFMPPKPGDAPAYALFFVRADFGAQLDQPLRVTLPDPQPPLPDNMRPDEISIVETLTSPNFYAFRFSQLQDGRAFMVLNDPARVQTDTTGSGGSGGGQDGGTTTTPTDQTTQ